MSDDRIDQRRADDRYYQEKIAKRKQNVKNDQRKMSQRVAAFDQAFKNKTDTNKRINQELNMAGHRSKVLKNSHHEESVLQKLIQSQGQKQKPEQEKLQQEERAQFYKKYNIDTKSADEREEMTSRIREKTAQLVKKENDKSVELRRRDQRDIDVKEEKVEDKDEDFSSEENILNRQTEKTDKPVVDYRVAYYQGGGQQKEERGKSQDQSDDSDDETEDFDSDEKILVGSTKNPHQIAKMKIESIRSSSGEQRFTLSPEMIENMAEMIMLKDNQDGNKEIEIKLSDQYYNGVRLKFVLMDHKVDLTVICPNSRVKNTFLMNRSSLLAKLEKKNIKISRIHVI